MIHPTAIIGEPPEARGVDQRAHSQQHPPVIDESASIGAYVTIDAGIDVPTDIGAHALLMKHVHIGHDAKIGDDCELAPGVVICGYAILDRGVKLGVNACVLPYVFVGKNARIGAGAVVTKEVSANDTFVGNPARYLPESDDDKLKCGCWPNIVNPECRWHGYDGRLSQFTSS